MKKKDYVRVSVILYEQQGGILVPRPFERRFKKYGVTVIHNTSHKLMQLRKASVVLFFFLTEYMKEDNMITSNKQLRLMFQNHLTNMGVKPVKDSSFEKAIQELVKTDLLIKTPTRGMYVVNPRHAHKTSYEKRGKLLEQLMKHVNDDEWQKTNVLRAMGTLI